MKKIVTALLFVFLAAPVTSFAEEDLRAQCEQYATEDNVSAEDREMYIKECMGEPKSEGSDEGADQKPSE